MRFCILSHVIGWMDIVHGGLLIIAAYLAFYMKLSEKKGAAILGGYRSGGSSADWRRGTTWGFRDLGRQMLDVNSKPLKPTLLGITAALERQHPIPTDSFAKVSDLNGCPYPQLNGVFIGCACKGLLTDLSGETETLPAKMTS